MRISQRFSPESCFWANSWKKVSVCKAVAFTLLFKTCRVQCNAKSLFVFGWKNVVIFGMCARHIVICIASINSSTRRVHLKLTPFSIEWKCDATFESKENGSNGYLCCDVFHFHFYLFRNSTVCSHILNAHCFQWGLFIGASCFLAIYIGPLKRVWPNCISMNYEPVNGNDANAAVQWTNFGTLVYHHISLSASKTSNECCLGSYEYACQMYSHYKRIHWFDISFDGISGFLFLDCANCYEPYFICEREQQPSNKF